MSTEIVHPPKTIMEVYKSLPEGTLAELIDNVIVMSPSPLSRHQLICNRINNRIFNYLEQSETRGEVFTAPMDVYLDQDSNAVQPDIIVILDKNLEIIDLDGHIHGVPDILVEVLSPGNKNHDLITKKALYARFRVKEYWIIDPEDKLAIGYTLEDQAYSEFHRASGTLESELLDHTFKF
ncbi:MAG: Uma2 family endonuclease [Bacteroidota bacterium]